MHVSVAELSFHAASLTQLSVACVHYQACLAWGVCWVLQCVGAVGIVPLEPHSMLCAL